ncbi:hypothetical protein FEM48_Zijuj07G0023500 [Ziziphus jujuba var. spinosa]|uniref:UDP-glycosyltransferase 89C1-like n=1 Tax=Ziziphus jujuba var. spinosa TaxID=714518 RepID=A0A978V1W5_ZIZJJ|nr:hypothetical protein FEM48_Zijuj07G0023500 [Ziziphus jujuba var. spinosa]
MSHVLVIPYPAPGHLLPTLDLCNQLALKGLTLTILVTPKNLPLLQPLLSLHPSIETLVFPFPSHPNLPPGIENMQELPISYIPSILSALSTFHDPLVQWFQSHSSPPIAIITDSFFTTWTHPLASHLGIKNLAFSPLNAHGTLGWWKALENRLKNFEHFVVEGRVVDMVTWGVILNSFNELEEGMLEYLKKNVVGHDNIWAVGPFLPIGNDPLSASKKCGSSSIPETEVLHWLNSCHVDKSVVYIGFGSQIRLTNNQMHALADALENSGVRFIWSVKDPMKGANNELDYFNDHDVCEGLKTVPDSVNLARVLVGSMSVTSDEKRSKAMELGKLALNAAKHGGSSDIALDDLVKKLST